MRNLFAERPGVDAVLTAHPRDFGARCMGLLMTIRNGEPVSEDFQPIDLVVRASTSGGLRTVQVTS